MRIALRSVFIATTLLVLGFGTVAATPSNANTYTVDVTCPEAGGDLTMVVVNPNSSGRHLEGTNGKLVLASVVGEVTTGGVTYPLNFSAPDARVEHQDLTTCFINDTFVVPKTGQEFTVNATLLVILTPRMN